MKNPYLYKRATILFLLILITKISSAQKWVAELQFSPVFYEIPALSYKVDNTLPDYFNFQPKRQLSLGYHSLGIKRKMRNKKSYSLAIYYLNNRKEFTLSYYDPIAYIHKTSNSEAPKYTRDFRMQYNTDNLGGRFSFTIPIRKFEFKMGAALGVLLNNYSLIENKDHINNISNHIETIRQSDYYYDAFQIQSQFDITTNTAVRTYVDTKIDYSPNLINWTATQLFLDLSVCYPIYKNKIKVQTGLAMQRLPDPYLYLNLEVGKRVGANQESEKVGSIDINRSSSFISLYSGINFEF